TAASNCEQLQARGVKLVLDDFGAGYASLSYLQTMRFDEIKLDSSLTLGSRFPAGHRLIKGVLELCHAINVPCTAEHLETEADVDRLVALGCQYGQGFWLHRPLSAAKATAMATNQENLVRMVRRPA
ncbi:MAG: EAL domain-containing protein, partial [Verrucomicrobiaceae bacterium]